MKTNTSEVKKRVENDNNGTQTGHNSTVSRFPPELTKPEEQANRAAKSDVDFWKDRVTPRKIRGKLTPELYVRFREAGADKWVCLNVANKAEAARKARNLWLNVKAKGIDAAVAEFNPKGTPRPEKSSSVSEFLTAVKAVATVRRATFDRYEICLRRLVAGVLGLTNGTHFYPKGEGAKARREKIDNASLDILSTARVEVWRKAYIDAAPDELASGAAKNTTIAVIRNARALFKPELVALLQNIRVPNPLPLAKISAGCTTRRFKTTVDPRKLYAKALEELSGDSLTAFLLCITAGLRRAEADLLPWANVDLNAGLITIATTKWFRPKSEESKRTTPIPPDVVKHLEARRASAPGAEFVLGGPHPTNKPRTVLYRCASWDDLIAWLRDNELGANPVHELRKLSGSLVNAVAGLEAARRHLGHRNISTTANSYVTGSAALVNLAAPAAK